MAQCPSGTYGEASCAASMAPRVSAGATSNNVTTSNASRRRMERAIWRRYEARATGLRRGKGVRLALVLPVTGGLAVLEGSREQGAGSGISRLTLLPAPCSLLPLMTLSGLLLALHFWSWIASLRFTTVASSVVLVSLKPVFV